MSIALCLVYYETVGNIRAWGCLNREDVDSFNRAIRSDPAFKFEYDQLWDLNELTRLDVSTDVIRQQIDLSPPFAEKSHVAIVAANDAIFGMARMYQTFADFTDISVRVFRRYQEARDWLDSVRMPKMSE
jgi:hypothetical protein